MVAGFYAKNRMELAGDLKRKFLLQHSSVDIWSVLNLCFDPRFRLICYPFRHYMHRIYMEGKTFALPIFFHCYLRIRLQKDEVCLQAYSIALKSRE